MPRAYLHIGAHKTGTSSFQYFIKAQRDWLSSRGYYVPLTGQAEAGGHHPLARAISGLPAAPSNKKLLPRLIEESKERGHPDLLISSEMMSSIMSSRDLLQRYQDYFASFGYSVVAILYIRQLPGAWNSAYSQMVKTMGYSNTFVDFIQERLATVAQPKKGTWFNLFTHPDVEAIIKPYNKLVKSKGIVKAILEDLRISEPPPGPEPHVNKAPSPTEVFVCRQFLQELKGQDVQFTISQRPRLIETIRQLQFSDSRTYFGVTPDIAATIDAGTKKWRDEVAKSVWGATWEECFPGEGHLPEANDLDLLNPEDIDSEKINHLMDELRESWKKIKLETAHEVRPPWLVTVGDAMKVARANGERSGKTESRMDRLTQWVRYAIWRSKQIYKKFFGRVD